MTTDLNDNRAELERAVRRMLTADVDRIARRDTIPYAREVAAELKRRDTVEVAPWEVRRVADGRRS